MQNLEFSLVAGTRFNDGSISGDTVEFASDVQSLARKIAISNHVVAAFKSSLIDAITDQLEKINLAQSLVEQGQAAAQIMLVDEGTDVYYIAVC